MRVQIRCKGFESSDSLAEYTTRKVHQHLSRFGQRVSAVDARFSDINGPRGGYDKRCLFTVHVLGQAPLAIEVVHEDWHAGIDLALARVAEALGRRIERSRQHRAAVERGTAITR
jgi:putative sigma-54 modulation protein